MFQSATHMSCILGARPVFSATLVAEKFQYAFLLRNAYWFMGINFSTKRVLLVFFCVVKHTLFCRKVCVFLWLKCSINFINTLQCWKTILARKKSWKPKTRDYLNYSCGQVAAFALDVDQFFKTAQRRPVFKIKSVTFQLSEARRHLYQRAKVPQYSPFSEKGLFGSEKGLGG